MTIAFDHAKRATTLKERGLDFASAAEVFSGRHIDRVDDRKDYGETRIITAGFVGGRMVVVVWMPRDNARHVISMRYCHAKEETLWRQHMG